MSYGLYLNTLLSVIDNGEFDELKSSHGTNGVGEYLNLLTHIGRHVHRSDYTYKMPFDGVEIDAWVKSSIYSRKAADLFLRDLCGYGLLEFDTGYFRPRSTLFSLIQTLTY